MPEETTAPEQDKPVEAPEADAPSDEGQAPEVDVAALQKSYDELRSKFNERDSELSQYRDFYAQLSDPQTQAEALAALGLELEADEEEEYVDPEEALNQRLGQIEGFLTQQQEQAEQAELQQLESQYLEQSVAELEKEHGELSEKEVEAVLGLANVYRDDDGLPDVAGAYEALAAANQAAQERYLASKKASGIPEPGVAGSEKINLDTPEARAKLAASYIEASRAAEEG